MANDSESKITTSEESNGQLSKLEAKFFGSPHRGMSPEEIAEERVRIHEECAPLIAAEKARKAKMTPKELAVEEAREKAELARCEAEYAEILDYQKRSREAKANKFEPPTLEEFAARLDLVEKEHQERLAKIAEEKKE